MVEKYLLFLLFCQHKFSPNQSWLSRMLLLPHFQCIEKCCFLFPNSSVLNDFILGLENGSKCSQTSTVFSGEHSFFDTKDEIIENRNHNRASRDREICLKSFHPLSPEFTTGDVLGLMIDCTGAPTLNLFVSRTKVLEIVYTPRYQGKVLFPVFKLCGNSEIKIFQNPDLPQDGKMTTGLA